MENKPVAGWWGSTYIEAGLWPLNSKHTRARKFWMRFDAIYRLGCLKPDIQAA
jgi:hypothetical protein